MAWSAHRLAVLGVLAVASAWSCTSAAPPPTGAVACTFTMNAVPECFGYTDLNSDEVNNAKIQCGAEPAVAFVSACPTSGLFGCCHESMAGVTLADCYYGVPDDAGAVTNLQASCMKLGGSWSPTP